ncbi:MAG: hypothetical protein JSW21_07530, partial [Gammaproteobacteria bacterium]
MPDPHLIEWLRQLRGVEREYFDFRGQHRRVPDEIVENILNAFGHDSDDDAVLRVDAERLAEKDWRRVLQPVNVIRPSRSRSIMFTVLRPLLKSVVWQILLETGETLEGSVDPDRLPVVDERYIDDFHFCRLALELPEDVPLGYHRLRLFDPEAHLLGESSLIMVPERCYE